MRHDGPRMLNTDNHRVVLGHLEAIIHGLESLTPDHEPT